MKLHVLVLVLSVACLGAATRPTTAPATKPAQITEQAAGVLKELAEACGKVEAMEMEGVIQLVVRSPIGNTSREAPFASSFLAPNLFRHEVKDQPLLGCTGQKLFAWSEQSGSFIAVDAPKGRLVWHDAPVAIEEILVQQNPLLALILSVDPVAELKEAAEAIRTAEPRTVNGKALTVLEVVLRQDLGRLTLLIDPQTHLVRRAELEQTKLIQAQGRPDVTSAVLAVDYRTIVAGATLKVEQFAWTPPEGAKDLVAMAAAEEARGGDDGELAGSDLVGQAAPDFSLENLDGKQVSLSDLKGSVVVLDFWATWCGPCEAGLKRLNDMAGELEPKGLKAFAVNLREDKGKAAKYVKDRELKLQVLLDGDGTVAKNYGVEAIPNLVVIDKKGVVAHVAVGFDPRGEEKLRKLIADELGKP